jgi:hypothetical protein
VGSNAGSEILRVLLSMDARLQSVERATVDTNERLNARIDNAVDRMVEQLKLTNQEVKLLSEQQEITNQRIDNAVDRMVEQLKLTNPRIDVTNEEVKRIGGRLDVTNEEVKRIGDQQRITNQELSLANIQLKRTNERIDHFIEISSERVRALEDRLQRVERHIGLESQ